MRRRWIALGLVGILLVVVGIAIGRRTADPQPDARGATIVTVTAPDTDALPPDETEAADAAIEYPRTPEGSVAAATEYVAALGGPAILDPLAVRATVMQIASVASRESLAEAYQSAAEQARARLGVSDATGPVVVRTTPVGYHVDGFHTDAATVSIWRVGIVGGGAATEARQSWRTETVSLVWEDDTWKIDALRSSPGPTPPLAGPPATPPGELAAAIPGFEEYANARP